MYDVSFQILKCNCEFNFVQKLQIDESILIISESKSVVFDRRRVRCSDWYVYDYKTCNYRRTGSQIALKISKVVRIRNRPEPKLPTGTGTGTGPPELTGTGTKS